MEIKKRRPRKGGAGVDGPKRKHCIAFQGCHFFSRGRDAQKSHSITGISANSRSGLTNYVCNLSNYNYENA
jgi:hypothetical protein